jgi:hypothetical protein
MQRLKSAILAIFEKELGYPYPVITIPQKSLTGFKKEKIFWVPMNS